MTYTDKKNKSGSLLQCGEPFVLSASSQNGQRITAVNVAAGQLGIYVGMPLTDARAIHPSLLMKTADPEGDNAALHQLALWCQCYSPFSRPDVPDGLTLDITGCVHLFDGEAALLEELKNRLHRFGLTALLVTAPTVGAAWAAARYTHDPCTVITRETLHEYLAPLPVAALRLGEPTITALNKVGLKQIGDCLGKPRAPLAARFGPELIDRLDQVFGRADESLDPLTPSPSYRTECRFTEPLVTISSIERVVGHLSCDLAGKLTKAGKGARKLQLTLFRVDGWFETLGVHTSALALSYDASHLTRLLCERLDQIKDHTGFGFEAATLSAFDVETIIAYQDVLQKNHTQNETTDDLARLLDRFVNRFGSRNVRRFTPHASYIPERAVHMDFASPRSTPHDWAAHTCALQGDICPNRPLLLFPSPEPVTVLSEVPDGPPIRFEWRRVSHRVTRADGPERIAPEWWHRTGKENQQTRDYYRVEDDRGRRFWLYRDGLYEREADTPHWFVHGVFG